MQETEQNIMNEKDLQRLKELRLMDDDFFSEALDGKNEAVAYILNTILERDDIKVTSTKAQVEYKSATKRSIILDIRAEEVRYLKETEGGRSQMCKLLEEMRNEATIEATHKTTVDFALKLLARGRDSIEEIAEMTGLSLEAVRELAKKQTA